jgi:protein-disulfide isomerase
MSGKKNISSILEKVAPILFILTTILILAVALLWQKVAKLEKNISQGGVGATQESALSINNLKKYAKELKLNTKDFNKCLDDGEKVQKVKDDISYAETLGVSGTPAFFVNGHMISGAQPYSLFQMVIDFELSQGDWNKPASDLKAYIDQGAVFADKVNVNFDGTNVEGSSDAKVDIVEFSDFECPFCTRFYKETYEKIKKTYIDTGKVKFSFRHYPLSFHQNAQKAAEASECAASQGKFWEYHNLLFSSQ